MHPPQVEEMTNWISSLDPATMPDRDTLFTESQRLEPKKKKKRKPRKTTTASEGDAT